MTLEQVGFDPIHLSQLVFYKWIFPVPFTLKKKKKWAIVPKAWIKNLDGFMQETAHIISFSDVYPETAFF